MDFEKRQVSLKYTSEKRHPDRESWDAASSTQLQ